MIKALINASVFDGENQLRDHAVLVDGDRVSEVIPLSELPIDSVEKYDLNGCELVPGFIDLQVNGGGGVMFNNAPTMEAIRTIGAGHRQFGTAGFMPTLITTSFDVMEQAISAVNEAIAENVPGVLGIHLEGPFLNPEKKGAHDEGKFCQLDERGLDLISSLKNGKTIVTLAPERTTDQMISELRSRGVVVCAGHSNADYQQTRQALAAGLSGFTHLYNAMTPLLSREPGMVGAALENRDSWFGIIADGYHLHPAAFQVAVAAKQRGGAVLVTDAMSTVGAEEKSFVLDGETIHSVDGRCVNASGSLAGSDLDMMSAVNNAYQFFACVDWQEALRMASLYPARALGLGNELGLIKPGYRANFTVINQQRQVVETWVDGIRYSSNEVS